MGHFCYTELNLFHYYMDKKATIFEFSSYKFESAKKRILFNYKTEFKGEKPLFFTETILLPNMPDVSHIPKELINKILESLHIILGISYYKLYCATKVRMAYNLSEREADFWNIVYKKGLGEFFYKNKLNPDVSPKFPFSKNKKTAAYPLQKNNDCLVGVGGGKDSIVVVELLKQYGFNLKTFFVKTNTKPDLTETIIKKIGVENITIRRILDSQVFQKHQYHGHIPISAIYAFLGLLTSIFYKYSYVIVGNEHSSNFGNLAYKGLAINHQWSKSFEFETLLQDYIKNSVSPDLNYFSLLRGFYEIRIVKMFSTYRKYFPYFSSCNQNFKIQGKNHQGLWCGQCAKCVFVFTLLSAFIEKKELLKIFKKNLYQDKNLLPLFKDVLGLGEIHPHTNLKDKFGITIAKSEAALPVVDNSSDFARKIGVGVKPFDCVGTFQEAKVSLYMASKEYKNDFIVRQIMAKIKINKKDIKDVFSTAHESNIPQQFKFLGMENALILGYGKEGGATKKYLEKYYPKMKIGTADITQGKNYLKNIKNYDIIIKTPGIPKEKLMVKTRAPITIGARPSTKISRNFNALVPYTTATNIFFSEVKGKNLIIGVTGSKGKSTTSSLIFEIIKTASKDVKLLGNIGKAMLEALLTPVKKGTIFVLELSSYQLDDLTFSPDIAVVTNLFPEHMDYHKGLKNYFKAKKNIINFQNKDNYFVYEAKNKKMVSWLKDYRGTPVPFEQNVSFEENETRAPIAIGARPSAKINFSAQVPLIGEHNKNNIKAAISVAKILHIPDDIIKDAIKKFKGLPHRLEFAGEFKGIKFYDDGSSTNPESAILAIKALKNIDTIFLGGEDRGYDFSDLENIIKKYNIKNIVLFPNSGKKILKSETGFNVLHTKSMKEAVLFSYKNTPRGGVCLLSGASPSYSLWKNFEAKGNEFKKMVKKLSRSNKFK